MINLKEHIKLSGIYTFFTAFPVVLQLIVYPIIEGADKLGAEDFGYLAIAEAIVSFLAIYCLFGMAITIARLYFDYSENKTQYKQLVATIFSGIIFRALLLLPLFYFFATYIGGFFKAGPLQNFQSYGAYLIIIAFNRTIISVALSLYRNEKKLQNFVIVSIVSGIARSVFQVVGVLHFDLSFKGYLIGTSIGGGIAALLILVYTFHTCRFSFSNVIQRKTLKFATPLFLSDLMFWGILFFDRFLLLKNPEQLGIYDNAMKFAMGVYFISQGLANAVQPELFRFFKKGFSDEEKNIKSLSNIFIAENLIVVGLVIIPIMLFIDNFYETRLLLSAGIISIVLLRYIANAQYQIFLWPVIFLKKTKMFFYFNLATLFLSVALNIILIPLYEIYGAIMASVFACIFQVIIFYLLQQRLIKIKWNKFKVLYFPFAVVFFTIIMELTKIKTGLNMYLFAVLTVLFIFGGLTFIYKKEILERIRRNRL